MPRASLRIGLAALASAGALAAAPAVAAPRGPVPVAEPLAETVQYYCPPGLRYSYRRGYCVPYGPPPPPPPYYGGYYRRPPPPAYYAPPPPPRYPPPGVGLYYRY